MGIVLDLWKGLTLRVWKPGKALELGIMANRKKLDIWEDNVFWNYQVSDIESQDVLSKSVVGQTSDLICTDWLICCVILLL